MGGEMHVLVQAVSYVYHGVKFILTGPSDQVQPVIDRIIYYVMLVLVLKWIWWLATRKMNKK